MRNTMTSANNIIGTQSPQQAASTQGLRSRERVAWTDIFAGHATRHMAAMGNMSLKAALEVLIDEDSKQPERDTRG